MEWGLVDILVYSLRHSIQPNQENIPQQRFLNLQMSIPPSRCAELGIDEGFSLNLIGTVHLFLTLSWGGGGRIPPPFSLIAYYSKNRAYNLYQYLYVNS